MANANKKIKVYFYSTDSGREPVREWLRTFGKEDSYILGSDIKTVEQGWPIGMPVCRSLGDDIWEVRSNLTDKRIARVLFCVQGNQMILLHGFIKKTQKTPKKDKDLALQRKRDIEKNV